MTYADIAAEASLRTAIKRAKKSGRRLLRGPCGTFDACGGTFNAAGMVVRMPKGAQRLCPLCALLVVEKESTAVLTNEHLLEELAAEALGVEPDWVISMLRGWDGDEYGVSNEVGDAYRIGKKLWRDMGEEVL